MEDVSSTPCFPAFLFPPISWWQKALDYKSIHILENERWVKQSFRNRIEIYGPNNRQRLTFPIVGSTKHGSIKDVELDRTHNWAVKNWRSIETAYRNSPFFEYYAHEIEPVFVGEYESLWEMNLASIQKCIELLNVELEIVPLEARYNQISNNFCSFDFRISQAQQPYYQVFADRNGFQENLSVLDLLFNVGPEASSYLIGD